MRPNLFSYATSELSQDAFLCWLLEWADAKYDGPLHRAGLRFLGRLLETRGIPMPDAPELVIERQHRDIDVLAVVDGRIAVLIEDKVGTSAHSGQLQKYLDIVANEHPGADVVPVFLKTGDQAHYHRSREHGYAPITRADLVEVLRVGRDEGIEDAIYRDFLDHVEGIEAEFRSYASVPLDGWKWRAWQGFYSALRAQLRTGDWGYVANPSGGFQGFWWGWRPIDGGDVYLQLEQPELCAKVRVRDRKRRSEVRNRWSGAVRHAPGAPVTWERPGRFGHGEFMTVAVAAGDYRVVGETQTLDLGATVDHLASVTRWLEAVVP